MDSKAALRGITAFALLNIAGCGGGGGNGQVISPVQVASVSPNAANDSTETPLAIIDSGVVGDPSFSQDTLLRTGVTMNYMVHEAPAATNPKGLIVLISGGYISTDVDSAPVSNVFLSRSAHLFAANGYKVVTIEHPSDYSDYFPDPIPNPDPTTGGTIAYDPENPDTWADGEKNYAWYDEYRASQDQRDDLSAVIDIENADTLPVFLIGYGRGAISAAAAADLTGVGSIPWTVQGVVMVSPATHGGRGFLGNNPVPTNSTINVPVYITYHNDDTCQVFPSNSTTVPQAVSLFREKMIQNGNSIDAVALTGGFESAVDKDGNPITYNPCEALTFHGFLGIESGTATLITDWISDKL